MSADRRARLAWLGGLALASGFPFGLVNETLPVYLRTAGADLVHVGLVSAATFPWTFKFLWAPLVDRFGSRRWWIAGCLGALAAVVLLLGGFDARDPAPLFWLLVVGAVVLSATQDVAIDAYTIEVTPQAELGLANSVRIAAYRVAMFAAGGGLIWLGGRAGWPAAFRAGAVALLALALLALALPRAATVAREPQPLWAPVAALLQRRHLWAIVLFALLFKLDISALDPMTRPFWVDSGFTLEEIGKVLTTGRLVATVAGAMLGGVLTSAWGIYPALWRLGAIQMGSALGYWVAAVVAPSKPLLFAVALFENFAAGLGTTAFVACLMAMCERRHAATQYALLSSLLALSRSVAGGLSGGLAERMGYAPFFLLTFGLGLPAFLLLPWIRRVLEAQEARAA